MFSLDLGDGNTHVQVPALVWMDVFGGCFISTHAVVYSMSKITHASPALFYALSVNIKKLFPRIFQCIFLVPTV